ncbi:hypothetical protein L6R50_23940 [Myxococcota bacterium]|nr:hypothetical protein [Myxococcota bacterium]
MRRPSPARALLTVLVALAVAAAPAPTSAADDGTTTSPAAAQALDEAQRLFREAQIAFKRGNDDEGRLLATRTLDACERALKEDPNLAAAYLRRALTREIMGDFDGARADLKTYLVAEPIEGQRYDGRSLLERMETRSGYHSTKSNPRRDLGVALTFVGAGTGIAGAALVGAAASESAVSNAAHDQALWDGANRLHTGGWITVGAGAGVAIAGAVLWIVHSRGRRVTVSDAGSPRLPVVAVALDPATKQGRLGIAFDW